MLPTLTKHIHNALLTRTFLNSISIIAGISLWGIITHYHTYRNEITLPLLFDNGDNLTITAPERMRVLLHGPRAALRESGMTGAIHVDATKLKAGKQLLLLSQKDLLLPTAAKLIHYTPVHVVVIPSAP